MKFSDVFSFLFNAGVNALRPPIGIWGDLVFEVSSELVRTYDDYQRESKLRLAKHELIGRTTVIEHLGRDAETISFSMTFNRRLGVNPSEEVSKLRAMCLNAEAHQLILGNCVVGDNLWLIETVGEEVEAVDSFGKVITSSAKVSMVEYVAEVDNGV